MKCLPCLLITASKAIPDKFYQVKLQRPAASFSSPSCTGVLKFLSITQKVCPSPGRIKVQDKTKLIQFFSTSFSSSMALLPARAESNLSLKSMFSQSLPFLLNFYEIFAFYSFTETITVQNKSGNSALPSRSQI